MTKWSQTPCGNGESLNGNLLFWLPVSIQGVPMWKWVLYFWRSIESRRVCKSSKNLDEKPIFFCLCTPVYAHLVFEPYFRLPAFLANRYIHMVLILTTYIHICANSVWREMAQESNRYHLTHCVNTGSPYGNTRMGMLNHCFHTGNEKIGLPVSIWGSQYGNRDWHIPVSIQRLSSH